MKDKPGGVIYPSGLVLNELEQELKEKIKPGNSVVIQIDGKRIVKTITGIKVEG